MIVHVLVLLIVLVFVFPHCPAWPGDPDQKRPSSASIRNFCQFYTGLPGQAG